MSKVRDHLFFTILILIVFSNVQLAAQSVPINYTGWYGYDSYHRFQEEKPWGLWIESYWIRDEVIFKQNALFARVGLARYLKSGNRITGGLVYQYNYPIDAASLPYNWPDYRLFQQYLIRIPKAKGLLQFRLRLEERWLGRKNDAGSNAFDYYKYETSIIPWARKTFVLTDKFFVAVYQELWILVSTTDVQLDQSRTYAGVGVNLNKEKDWRLEMGYMYHPNFADSPDTDNRTRINHALRITVTSDAPFKRKKKG